MSRNAAQIPLLLVAAIAFFEPSRACVVHYAVPSVPLPPLPAAKPIEEFLPAHGGPPPVVSSVMVALVLNCGGAFDAEVPPALGLIDLFGSIANFETALAARRVEVALLGPRIEPFTPVVDQTPARRLAPADAARLRDWLTSDASYRWGQAVEWPVFSRGVRVSFYFAGKTANIDLYPAESVAVVGFGEAVIIVTLEPRPSDIEDLLTRVRP